MRHYNNFERLKTDDLTDKAFKSCGYVSDFERGVILSKTTRKPMKGILSDRGYLKTSLSVDGHHFSVFIHRALFIAANGVEPTLGKQISHINRVKTDNKLSNLQALTPNEHNKYDGIDITKYSNNNLKTSWSSCILCGDLNGWIHPKGKTPVRYDGKPFGLNGELCFRCYSIENRKRKKQLCQS